MEWVLKLPTWLSKMNKWMYERTHPHICTYIQQVCQLYEMLLRRQWKYPDCVQEGAFNWVWVYWPLSVLWADDTTGGSGQRRENFPFCLHPQLHVSALRPWGCLSIMSKHPVGEEGEESCEFPSWCSRWSEPTRVQVSRMNLAAIWPDSLQREFNLVKH